MNLTIPESFEERPIAVIGGGTLGRTIAFAHAAKGATVRVYDPYEVARCATSAFVDERRRELGPQADGPFGEVSTLGDLALTLRGAWFVVEAVPERRDVKTAVLSELDKAAEPDAIIGTNSTTFPSRMLISKVLRPERVLNTHYYRPPEFPAVDLMSCGRTHRSVIDFMLEALPRYGLRPFEMRTDSGSFIPIRLWAAMKREAMAMVAEGLATPAEIDEMTTAAGYTPLGRGVFQRMDNNGLDVALDIENHALAHDPTLPMTSRDLLLRYVEAGKLGRKSGEGFYRY